MTNIDTLKEELQALRFENQKLNDRLDHATKLISDRSVKPTKELLDLQEQNEELAREVRKLEKELVALYRKMNTNTNLD